MTAAEPQNAEPTPDRNIRTSAWERAWPAGLRDTERQRIGQRRAVVNAEAGDDPARRIAATAPEVGVGLSGGGIRAATFDLGVFQALARHRLIRRIDWLSTVSGGGYFGGFLGRLHGRDYATPDRVEALLHPSSTGLQLDDGTTVQPVSWLRQNGRYMAPNGSGDVLMTAAVAFRNVIALHLLIGLTVLLALLLVELPVIALERWDWLQAVLKPLPSLGHGLLRGTPFTPSPWLDLVPLLVIVTVVPPGWAYWLIEGRSTGRIPPVFGLVIIMVMALAGLFYGFGAFERGSPRQQAVVVALLAVLVLATLALLAYGRALRSVPGGIPPGLNAESLHALSMARARITDAFAGGLQLSLLVAALGAFDTLGLSLYRAATAEAGLPVQWLVTVGAVLAPVAARLSALRQLMDRLGAAPGGGGLGGAALTVLAIAAWLALFAALSALAHAICAGFAPPSADPRGFGPVATAIGLVGLLVLLTGSTWTFVNRSSHASLYSARLTRAFLGASNPARHEANRRASVRDPLPNDDDSIPGYHAALLRSGGPLHFINVTINETASAAGRTVLRDRKGIGLAVGPAGLSAGVQHHAAYGSAGSASATVDWVAPLTPLAEPGRYSMFANPARPDRVTRAERMSLGQWVAVSGAAFSTGLGSRTTLGMSLLMGFANVRLGRWWDSGRDLDSVVARESWPVRLAHRVEALLPVQTYLFDELTGRFRGSKRRHWYLTDGGHFENMAGYELIRRRVPMIVIVDAEEDAGFIYEGFAGLMRKARTDFGASIVPLDAAALDRAVHPARRALFGALDTLGSGDGAQRAVLARVCYDDGRSPPSTLLYVKPTLRRSDPADLHEYRAKNPSFPHQPTLDQFFDEAQWESYRKLGETIGDALFAPLAEATDDDPRFVPQRLRPIDDAAIDAWQARCRWQAATRLGGGD